ncbi:YraN family protein [Halomonas sp. PR-M31]|uniref:YraN family protein n=1 Tax=Halomonas sp. PR-M31 TaxID=1471202 RepID=UPI000650509E|nr:YraN family protein [Halomonas sp. PR-M31]
MKPSSDARQRGEAIEGITAKWLQAQGLIFVARNQHAKGGEIDLIMRDGDTLVFIEVRHRTNTRYGHPLETVNITKQQRLIRAARFYLLRNRLSCACRFDVVGVVGTAPQLEFTWVRAAFDAF